MIINNLHVYYNRYLLNKQGFICIIKKLPCTRAQSMAVAATAMLHMGKKVHFSRAENVLQYVPREQGSKEEQMQVIRWQDRIPPQEHHLRLHMQQEELSPYTWSNDPNYSYAVHTHNYQKVLYCVRGSIRFLLQANRLSQEKRPPLTCLQGTV